MIEKYQYNTKYKNEHFDEYRKECIKSYGSPCMLDLSKECDVKMFHNLVGIDESRIPDAYNMKVFMVIPCKWHKKKRINKKLLKNMDILIMFNKEVLEKVYVLQHIQMEHLNLLKRIFDYERY